MSDGRLRRARAALELDSEPTTLRARMESVLIGAASAAEVLPEDVTEFLEDIDLVDAERTALEAREEGAKVRQNGLALLREIEPRLTAEQRERAAELAERFQSLPSCFALAVQEQLRERERKLY